MTWVRKIELYQRFNSLIADSNHSQTSAFKLLSRIPDPHMKKLLDFGCGEGLHQNLIQEMGFRWFGVDIRSNTKDSVVYDGINLPFRENSFDVIFTNQVVEHLEFPDLTLNEVNKVLREGGIFCGGVSYLEPFHASSTFNMTPYGLKILLDRNGFELESLFPGLDSISLIISRVFDRCDFLKYFLNRIVWKSKESPLNRLINLYGRLQKLTSKEINAIKIILAGHICFFSKKVENKGSI